jgi:hypothetical protein
MRILALACYASLALLGQESARVFLISLDGFGFEAMTKDPAAQSMRHLQKLAREGVAAPMQAAFPSLTAAGHASLFTGAYGNENGVTANLVSLRPRSAHRFDERANGFRAEHLDRENFWLPLARQGIRTVAHNSTQGYPCTARNAGSSVAILNGYQTEEIAPERVLSAKDVEWLPAAPTGIQTPPRSRKPVKYFRYAAKDIRLFGALYARSRRYDSIRISAPGNSFVDASLRSAEDESLSASPQPRALARFFSDPLWLTRTAGVYFRLFEVSEKADEFLLYQTPAKEISLCVDGATQDDLGARTLVARSGAFIGNGAGGAYSRGAFGPVLKDGRAERRFLETLELHARQTMRMSKHLFGRFNPRLLVDYLSTTDDMLHLWWGWAAQSEAFLDPYREWGYQIADWRIGELLKLRREQDHLIVVSDHGMTAMTHELRVNKLLSDWGLRDQVFASYYGLFANTSDWQDGKIDPARKRTFLDDVKRRLESFRFEDKPVFRSFFWPEELADYGVGGDRAADLYFDLEPGWSLSYASGAPAARRLEAPRGEHGPIPTRPDLLSVFVHYGPDLHTRPASLKTTDVAGIISRLLQSQ